jgi:hypothetical protein
MSSVRNYAILYIRGTKSGGTVVGGGNAVLDTGQHALDGPEHTNPDVYVKAIGGGEETVFAHGSMGAAETIDPADGNWHTGTFDDDCTFTLTAPTNAVGCSIICELTQDGTGGHALTLPASVVNRVALEAAQVTTLSTTAFLLLITRDGGTNWYGFWAGGGSISPLTTKGDLWGYDTADARVPVGTDGYLLTAASMDTQGVAWENPETTGHYEILMDGSGTAEPLEDGSGADWLYVWVP